LRGFSGILLTGFLGTSAAAQFGPGQLLLPDPGAGELEAVDVDASGSPDLVHFSSADGWFRWASNADGQGGFLPFADLVHLPGTVLHAFADVDGDLLPDLVTVNADGAVYSSLNLGAGLFAAPTLVDAGTGDAGALVLANVFGEALPEIILTRTVDGMARIAVFPNVAGSFAPSFLLAPQIAGDPPTVLLAGDLDNSGGTDLLYVDENNAAIGLFNVNGDGSEWTASTLFHLFDYPLVDPVLLDVDGDGFLDVAEAGNLAVQWVENRIDEGIPFNTFTVRLLEPFTSAGPGRFAHLDCGPGASVVFSPSIPGEPVRWGTYLPATQRFSPRQPLPTVDPGQDLLLADVDADGRPDLLVWTANGISLHMNQLQPPSTTVVLPALDTLCVAGPSVALPEGMPAGGTWSGTWVTDNTFHRSSVGGTATVPLAYTWHEPQGCPVGASTTIHVVSGPVILPALGNVVCHGQEPIQMSSSPAATEWFGLSEGNVLDLDAYTGELIVAVYTDPTGSTCVSFMGPLTVWNSVPTGIIDPGPLCVNDGLQTILPEVAWGNNTWGGDIAGTEGQGALFDPAQGAGTYTIHLYRTPTAPQQCAGSDTLTIVVSDAIPDVFVQQAEGVYCASTDTIPLTYGSPEGGSWSGPGVSGDVLLPAVAGAGTHLYTYTVSEPGGCSNSASLEIALADAAVVSHSGGSPLLFCANEGPVQLEANPGGGEWGGAVDPGGLFDPGTAGPGSHGFSYLYTDPNGCVLSPATSSIVVRDTLAPVIDEVGPVCLLDAPFAITGTPEGSWGGVLSGTGSSVLFDPMALGLGSWTVTLTAEADGLCPGTASLDVLVEVCSGIAEATAQALLLAPNPTAGQCMLTSDGQPVQRLWVTDARGRTVLELTRLAAGTRQHPLDLGPLAPGAYNLHVLQDAALHVLKLVKE
jgi:hypothetical protein